MLLFSNPCEFQYEQYRKYYNLLVLNNRDQFIEDFINKVYKNLDARLLIPPESTIIVAVSGGVDSVVLFDVLYQIAYRYNYNLVVCHFNHKLRGLSSDKDEGFVKSMAVKYKVKSYTDNANVKAYSENNSVSIEHAARILRYQFFERISKSLSSQYVATAHTADDSAETVLMNLLRGSGITGLSGIPEKRMLAKKVYLVRPLINFKKSDIKQYAELRNIKWHEDSTNSLLFYTRNKIRLDLIPKLQLDFNPSIIDTLNRTARLLQGADNFISENISHMMKYFKWDKKRERLYIGTRLINTLDEFIRGELIQYAIENKFKIQSLSLAMIDRIFDLTLLESGSIVHITKEIIALKDRGYLVFTKYKEEKPVNILVERVGEYKTDIFSIKLTEVSKNKVKYEKNPNIEYLDMDLLPAIMTFRNWENGDSFQPIGMAGSIKLSDFLINNKISMFDKKNVMILSTKNEIVWVCGLRMSDKFKIDSTTRRFLKVEYQGPSFDIVEDKIEEESDSNE